MALMTAFAAAALLLAGLGVYGVLSYAVSRRSREISVRMALGAPPAAIVWMVARHGLALTLAGALAGAFGAFALGRALSGLLFGVGPGDPRALAAAVGLLLVVALIASVLPARRASALDPLDVLRGE
jgi:ABC-type antimicrobial peptide transport system permease subunit